VFGAPVPLTASVSPAAATGSVQFFKGATALGSAPLASGQAQLTISNLPAGADSLTAIYSGDSANAGSTSAAFIQTVIDKHSKSDPTIKSIVAKDCMFRINRDVRFSKDKSPYKTNMGAYINRGGKKSVFAGYYFHCEPGQCFVGGGLWMPMSPELNKVRQEIDYNLDAFKKIVTSKKFTAVYKDLSHDAEYVLTRVPKGYEPTNPAAEYLKMKSFVSMAPLKDSDITSKDLVKRTTTAFEALQPLIDFINESLR
jgi:uncharacterized protein (TIGR02453 family)